MVREMLLDLLDGKGINLMVAEDALARICFVSSLVGSIEHGRIVYIDLDTVFTAYTRHGMMMGMMRIGSRDVRGKENGGVRMDIFIPDKGRLEHLLAHASSSIDDDTGLVVLDSIHGFYHLYDGVNITSLNQLLTSYISLLGIHAGRYSIPFLVTSIRKRMVEEPRAYGSRYLWSKSSAILSARYSHRDQMLLVHVLKHRIDTLRDTVQGLKVADGWSTP
ncbi:MAG: hypothetical protein NZ517_06730 [Candidatus Nitrosocaldus sp.]|nr:hypothetical protein [Candidatus Nitrosocaldus sp.]